MSTPEFSRPIAVNDVPPQGLDLAFEATAEECMVLAKRFGLLALSNFSGRAHLRPWRRTGLALQASFRADVRQACVVSLEPVDSQIEEKFDLYFLPADIIEKFEAAEIIVDSENAEDVPEPLEGDVLDLGEVLAEQLALSIDPYPRKPGIVFEVPKSASDAELKPFAALEALKKGK